MLLIHHEFEGGVLDVNVYDPKGLSVNVCVHITLPIGPIEAELPFIPHS